MATLDLSLIFKMGRSLGDITPLFIKNALNLENTLKNFGYWKIRLLMMAGRMPVSSRLPSKWYETKNIHLCTIKDFEELCAELNLKILEKIYLDDHGRPLKKLRRGNLLAAEGVYLIGA